MSNCTSTFIWRTNSSLDSSLRGPLKFKFIDKAYRREIDAPAFVCPLIIVLVYALALARDVTTNDDTIEYGSHGFPFLDERRPDV